MVTVKGWKLLRVRRDGTLGPLFINRRQVLPYGVWLEAEDHPTKGYRHRPGWHATLKPVAPHLSMKGRRWVRCSLQECEEIVRPESQGGTWLLAKRIKLEVERGESTD